MLLFGAEYLSFSLLSKNFNINKYINIILPPVLCGCETWSLALRQELRLRIFENGVLRRIFGPKRDKVTVERTKLRNEVINDLYCSLIIVRVTTSRITRRVVHVVRMGGGERRVQSSGEET